MGTITIVNGKTFDVGQCSADDSVTSENDITGNVGKFQNTKYRTENDQVLNVNNAFICRFLFYIRRHFEDLPETYGA